MKLCKTTPTPRAHPTRSQQSHPERGGQRLPVTQGHQQARRALLAEGPDHCRDQQHPGAPWPPSPRRIQETSKPSAVQSLVLGQSHNLFILDTHLEGSLDMASHVIVYLWDYKPGKYEAKERLLSMDCPRP